MIRLVVLGGTGDVYLIASLFEAFKRHQNRDDVELVIKSRYGCIAEMFGLPYTADDALIQNAERDQNMQRDYDNVIANGRCFYAHPSFIKNNLRVDHMTTKPDVSQADMYKVMLQIPPDEPLALPRIPEVPARPGVVLLIPEATSWPNNQPGFWNVLSVFLRGAGWTVETNNNGWSLKQLFEHCAAAEWVIGPQCGVMSILVTGRFPARKTLATPSIDGNSTYWFSKNTYPYAYVTKFSNQDYDVEEFKITDSNHADLVSSIAAGSNALRLWPHDPRPITSVTMPLTPGDFLDRLAILTVKREKFGKRERAAIEREYQRYVEARNIAGLPAEANAMFDELVRTHGEAFDVLAQMVPEALGGTVSSGKHVDVVRLNKRRVELKQAVDAACRGPYTEIKSYYGPR